MSPRQISDDGTEFLRLADKVIDGNPGEDVEQLDNGTDEPQALDSGPQRRQRTEAATAQEVSEALPAPESTEEPPAILSNGKAYKPDAFRGLTDGTTRWALEGMATFPAEHDVSPPARLVRARATVEQVVGEALASLDRLAEIPRAKNAWRRSVMEATTEAWRYGRPAPKKADRPDFEQMQDAALAEAQGLVARAKDARAAYDELAAELLTAESRQDVLTKALTKAHSEALEAVQNAADKAQVASTAFDALLALTTKEGLDRDPRQNLNLSRIEEHVKALTDELSKLDPQRPILVDTSKTRADMQTRQALSQAGDPASRYSIFRLERAEGYEVTSFTRDWPPLERVPGAFNYELGARSARY